MSLHRNLLYPYLVDAWGDPPPIKKIRAQLIPLAQGDVLEIGAGSGANFIHYDAARVTRLYALEPNPGMIRLARRQEQKTKLHIEYIGLPSERIPLEDQTIDTVVSTFTLCTIPRITEALQGIARVLKSASKFIFFELGLSPDPAIQRWQRRLVPVTKWLFQGLDLTRDIPSLMMQSGFEIAQIEMGYLADVPKPLTYGWWGVAKLNEKSVRQKG